MQFYETNFQQTVIFNLYTVYNKHEMIKSDNETRENRKHCRRCRIILLPTALSEIDFMYSTKESENKDTECIFCYGKFPEDEREEVWIKCFSYSLWVYPDCTGSENPEYVCELHKRIEAEMIFTYSLKYDFYS